MNLLRSTLLVAAMTMSVGFVMGEARAQAPNPCAQKTEGEAARPDLDKKLILRPKGTKLATGNRVQLVKDGEALFKSAKLSTNELSCASCHANNDNFNASFKKPYPHLVQMAKDRADLADINLDEMIQLCMVVPMASKPLPWNSRELAALTAYTGTIQATFRKTASSPSEIPGAPAAKKAANPCAPPNPCAPKK
ncbi:c-type cytochrome [Bradyrhizobium sp.]|uniref:c-type cytochrome n=1 Tax=Bradyrhizobium sp. TaxID=376 RepID=UPI00403828C0